MEADKAQKEVEKDEKVTEKRNKKLVELNFFSMPASIIQSFSPSASISAAAVFAASARSPATSKSSRPDTTSCDRSYWTSEEMRAVAMRANSVNAANGNREAGKDLEKCAATLDRAGSKACRMRLRT